MESTGPEAGYEEQAWAQILHPQAAPLTAAECWYLLASVPVGRVVFTMQALPAVHVTGHLIDEKKILISSHLGTAITGRAAGGGAIVCYQADQVDLSRRTGWSVSATGPARLVTDPAEAARYQQQLMPWGTGNGNQVIAIEARLVTGARLPG